MSTLQYYRLALLQWIRYNQSLEEVISLQKEIAELQAKVAAHQKKHRRSDKEIEKHEQCPHCDRKYGSEVALKLHLKLKHSPNSEAQDEESAAHLEGKASQNKQNIRNN